MTVRSGRRRRDLDGWPYRPLCARWFSALHLGHGRKGRPQGCPKPPRLWLGTLGHPLIEPKTPFYTRFDVLALVLTVPTVSGRPNTKAARLRANPEQVSNLANGVAVLEQLGRPIQDGRFQVVCHPPDSCPPRFAHECLDHGLERSLRALVSGMPQSVSKVRRVSTFAQTGGSLSHRLHS